MNITLPLRKVERRLGSLAAEIARLRKQAAKPRSKTKPSNALSDSAREALVAYLALTPALDEDALLQTLLKCAMHVVGAGGAGLTLVDPRKQKLVFRAAIGDGAEGIIGQEVPLKGSRHGLAFATGEVQSDTPLDAGVEKAARARFRNVLVAPLQIEGESVGTISAVNKQGADHFSAEDMAAYKLFADLGAVVVRQRCREQVLRRGSADSRRPSVVLPLALPPEDRQLLELFDSVTRVKHDHPEWLPLVKQFVEGVARSAS
ncbi:MAG TPA: GAF domain-containing protein [Opitutaceae bacterium]|nr:GAF domain-containing protein [Opitutaceae bacterium]